MGFSKRISGFVVLGAASSLFAVGGLEHGVARATASAAPAKSKHVIALTPAQLKAQAAAREAARQKRMLELAPGDEYFGPLKQSIIGIRNTIRDLGLRYDVNHDIAHQTFASAQLTERAIHDWEKRYPKDSQLPRAVYFLQRLYTKVLSQESRDRAKVTAQWLATDFRSSAQERVLEKTLAFEHLPPLPTAAPSAQPYASLFGPAYPSEFNAAAVVTTSASPAPAAAIVPH